MSLILDALRRAESERERGAVPGLYSQPVPPASSEAPRRARLEPWHWIAIGVGIGLLVVLASYIVGRDVALQEVGSAGTAGPAATTAPAAGEPVAAPAPVASVAAPMPPAEAPVAEPAPWPAAESRGDRRGDSRKPSERSLPAAPSGAKTDRRADAAATEPPVYAPEQLPEHIRAQLPPLKFGGSMYSSNPANRSLIINGQIFRENDQVAADLALVEIRLKAAVLRFKGYRFEAPY